MFHSEKLKIKTIQMKTKFPLLAFALAIALFFSSCDKDNNSGPSKSGSCFIINYGSYSGDKGEISLFNLDDSTVTNGLFKSSNGVDLISNIQYAYHVNDEVFLMGNNADQVFYVNQNTFEQTANGISGNYLVKPRYCVANGDILYVSCWGGDVWDDPSLSFISKINMKTHTVVDTIKVPGGPEGLAVSNGKLYAALNYDKKIAVIDLDNDAVRYITTPAVSSYFLKDASNNLYVTLLSTYSNTADQEGIGYINTQTNQLSVYELSGISTSYVNMLAFNKEQSKLYVMTSAYDANWNLSGAIAVFNTATKTFYSDKLISGVSGLNGFDVNPQNDDIYYFVSESAGTAGRMVHIKPDGTLIKEYTTGISPFMILRIDE
jgi:hypothetical protein